MRQTDGHHLTLGVPAAATPQQGRQDRNPTMRSPGAFALSAFVADLVAAHGQMANRRPTDLARHPGYLTG
jgi:hypothetical protein